jgi:predicted permease
VLEILGIVAPVFLCAAVGYGWIRLGRPYDRDMITRLITDLGAPCLVFSGLIALDSRSAQLTTIVGAALIAMACFAALGFAVLRTARLPSHTFLPPLVFGNTGNMGLPLCLFAFGDEGLSLAVCFFATVAITHYSVGVWVWSGRVSITELLRTPLFYGTLLGVAVLVADVGVPVWIRNTTQLLGGFTIPLMMITMGVSLAELRLHDLPRTLALSVFRLAMGVTVGFGLAELLGLQGIARGVVVIQCSMPVAVFNYLFAERYGRTPEAVASLVVLSTILAFGLLPFLLGFLL